VVYILGSEQRNSGSTIRTMAKSSLQRSLLPPLAVDIARWTKKRLGFVRSERISPQRIEAGFAKGLRLWLPEPASSWSRWISSGEYEPGLLQTVNEEASSGGVLYDVGAHIGLVSCLWCNSGGGRACAFEPSPRNASLIRENLKINNVDNARVYELAIAAECGRARFVVETANLGASSGGYLSNLTSGVMGLERSRGREHSVMLFSLDAIVELEHLPPPALVKIDVEGGEVDVVRGAVETIHRHRPKLLIEIHNVWSGIELYSLLASFGYRPRNLSPSANWPQVLWAIS
jgi:FkbM family methyltransferase